ncbi:CoA transferase [Phenylobacterium sp.]|uniref:CaiB/BaiF CoA transferase family protein n=1 Tax=Phenylobacterium sp. TaxID=1871053 RepID=UPI00301D4FBF
MKVLDLSLFLPGPMLTLALAQHGADVIKLEPPGEGDPTREIGERMGDLSVYFRNVNRGKRSIQLDLKSEYGRKVFWELAKEADVLIEGFRPGVAKRLGIDYAAVAAVNPRVIYCAISAFGQDGPDRDRPAHDLAVQALMGVLSLNLGRDGAPAQPHLAVADALASLWGLSGVLMALLRRETTGVGDYLDVAMAESLMSWTVNITHTAFGRGAPPEPQSERTLGGNAMYRLYETADEGWIVLGGSEPKFARELLSGLGREDLLPLAHLPPGRGQDPLRAFLEETFRTRTKADWVAWFAGRDICFAPVQNLVEGLGEQGLCDRGFITVDDEGYPAFGSPLRFLREAGRRAALAPALDEHRSDIETRGWG